MQIGVEEEELRGRGEDVLLVVDVGVPRPQQGRDWGAGTLSKLLDMEPAPDVDGGGGRRRRAFSLSVCCNYRTYQEGRKRYGEWREVAAADGGEGKT